MNWGRRRDVRTPFILIFTNFIILNLSGPLTIIFYAVEIFKSEEGIGLDHHLASIIVATTLVIGGILGIFLTQNLPRVRLSMVTMSLMSLCMAVLGGALYMTSLPLELLIKIKVSSLTVYMFCFASGQQPWRLLSQAENQSLTHSHCSVINC